MATTLARSIARRYDTLLQRHRLITSTVSGAVLSFAGDQVIQRSSAEPYDADRAAAFTIFGGVLTGPINYNWLDALERAVRRLAPAGGAPALAAKVTLQSVFFQPFVYLPTFFGTNAVVRGWSVGEVLAHSKAEFSGTLVRLWIVWTPAVVFTFGYLPVRQQAVFFSGVGFVWNCILSWYAGAGPVREQQGAGSTLRRLGSQPTPKFASRPSGKQPPSAAPEAEQ